MTTVNTDIDTVASDPSPLVLSSGLAVNVERLKTRQLMRLMKILTRGPGPALADLDFSNLGNNEEFAGQLLATVVFSIPEAEEETVDFVRSMVTPARLIEDPKTKAEFGSNEEAFERLFREMDNPEIDDLVSVLEIVIRTEAPHLVALGKRLALLIKTQQSLAGSKPSASSPSGSKRSTRKAS
jgi:hypothetical protein